MPVQKSKFSLAGAIQRHADDETDYGVDYSKLPGGVSGGIARLVDAKRGTYKSGNYAGEQFIRLAAAVVEPETCVEVKRVWDDEANRATSLPPREVRIKGLQSSQMLPLCDTGSGDGAKSADQNVEVALNMLRRVGGPECTKGLDSEESLDALLAELVSSAPYVRFSTSTKEPTKAYPNGGTWENWHGSQGLEDYTPSNAESNGTLDKSAPKAAITKTIEKAVEPEPEPEAEGEGDDVDALAALADKKDNKATLRLQEIAAEAGISEEAINGADSWSAVADLIKEAKEGGGESESEETEEEEFVPVKEGVYKYQVIDKKTGKPATDLKGKVKKPIEVEVTAIDKKTSTCTLLNGDDRKTIYKGVPWDQLIRED